VADLAQGLNKRVAVIGAGWAGLAAAVTLAERGAEVAVYEAARHVGGRARRVEIRGKALDNGQHILVGAYHETLRLMRQVGVDPEQMLLRLPLQLVMADGFRLRGYGLSPPLDGLLALATARGLRLAQRWRAILFALRLQRSGFRLPQDEPLAALLERHGQDGALRQALWGPLCVAALNTRVEEASAQVFLHVLRDTLHGGRGASDLLLPRASLGALFPEPAVRYVAERNGAVHEGKAIRRIERSGDRYVLDGEVYDAVIVATGAQHAADLLPEGCETVRAQIEALDFQPIYTCYLQYEAHVRLPFPMLGFRYGLLQWVFDRGTLDGHQGLIAAVISARGPHEALSNEELANAASATLQEVLGHPGAPQWHRVIAEKRATFACRPGLERPDNETPLPGLYLAGDYTRSDYPGTIEAAVRSGIRAAALCLA